MDGCQSAHARLERSPLVSGPIYGASLPTTSPEVRAERHTWHAVVRPGPSPRFRLVSDHLHRLQTVYDERFARAYGPWRPVVAQVADTFLACGVLDDGFARIRCDDCAHDYLLALRQDWRADDAGGIRDETSRCVWEGTH